jgi:NAD(P)-dependent dehydrogenase (short-subunit alcohol dehydrogenase family)
MRALVTGSSRGIGQATARLLAARGFDVAVHGHSHLLEAEALASELQARGTTAFVVPGDLASPEGPATIARDLREQWTSLDVVVHNAGAHSRSPFERLGPSEWLDCLQLNLIGPALLSRELLPGLRRSSAGRIVFIASVLASNGSAHGAHCASAKAGILGLMRSLARELAPGITVNAVAPGSIDPEILAGDTPAQRAVRGSAIPLGRIGRPEEVAEAVAFLASPEAAYVTGTTLHVNGGLRMD